MHDLVNCGKVVSNKTAFEGIGTLETGLEFLKQPEDVIVVRNSAVLLNCTATGDAASVNITWLKDGLLVNDARR
ncbi:hypothetical protein LSAT2_022817, partial [Lamellibrachia satsuma]